MEASGERTPHGYGSPTPTDIENCLMTDRGRRHDLLPEFHRALSANHAFVILSSEQQWRDHGLTNREIGEAKKVTKFEVNPANLSGFWREI